MCAAIGMSCGCGQYMTALIASLATLFVLILIRRLEKNFISKRKIFYTLYEVTLSASIEECEAIEDIFNSRFKKVFKYNKKLINSNELKFSAVVSTKSSLKDINEIFKSVQNIEAIEIREYYD